MINILFLIHFLVNISNPCSGRRINPEKPVPVYDSSSILKKYINNVNEERRILGQEDLETDEFVSFPLVESLQEDYLIGDFYQVSASAASTYAIIV